MDDVVEFVIELLGDLAEAVLKGIKNPQKRRWALTVFYSVITLGIAGFLLWGAVAVWKEGSKLGAGVFAGVAGILLAVFGFFIVRGHKRSWKQKSK